MTNKATARANKARAGQKQNGGLKKMELTLNEFMNYYHDNVPLRVRLWDVDKWTYKEGYVVDGKLIDDDAVLFDSLDALDGYYVSTVSGHDLPTANLYPNWYV